MNDQAQSGPSKADRSSTRGKRKTKTDEDTKKSDEHDKENMESHEEFGHVVIPTSMDADEKAVFGGGAGAITVQDTAAPSAKRRSQEKTEIQKESDGDVVIFLSPEMRPASATSSSSSSSSKPYDVVGDLSDDSHVAPGPKPRGDAKDDEDVEDHADEIADDEDMSPIIRPKAATKKGQSATSAMEDASTTSTSSSSTARPPSARTTRGKKTAAATTATPTATASTTTRVTRTRAAKKEEEPVAVAPASADAAKRPTRATRATAAAAATFSTTTTASTASATAEKTGAASTARATSARGVKGKAAKEAEEKAEAAEANKPVARRVVGRRADNDDDDEDDTNSDEPVPVVTLQKPAGKIASAAPASGPPAVRGAFKGVGAAGLTGKPMARGNMLSGAAAAANINNTALQTSATTSPPLAAAPLAVQTVTPAAVASEPVATLDEGKSKSELASPCFTANPAMAKQIDLNVVAAMQDTPPAAPVPAPAPAASASTMSDSVTGATSGAPSAEAMPLLDLNQVSPKASTLKIPPPPATPSVGKQALATAEAHAAQQTIQATAKTPVMMGSAVATPPSAMFKANKGASLDFEASSLAGLLSPIKPLDTSDATDLDDSHAAFHIDIASVAAPASAVVTAPASVPTPTAASSSSSSSEMEPSQHDEDRRVSEAGSKSSNGTARRPLAALALIRKQVPGAPESAPATAPTLAPASTPVSTSSSSSSSTTAAQPSNTGTSRAGMFSRLASYMGFGATPTVPPVTTAPAHPAVETVSLFGNFMSPMKSVTPIKSVTHEYPSGNVHRASLSPSSAHGNKRASDDSERAERLALEREMNERMNKSNIQFDTDANGIIVNKIPVPDVFGGELDDSDVDDDEYVAAAPGAVGIKAGVSKPVIAPIGIVTQKPKSVTVTSAPSVAPPHAAPAATAYQPSQALMAAKPKVTVAPLPAIPAPPLAMAAAAVPSSSSVMPSSSVAVAGGVKASGGALPSLALAQVKSAGPATANSTPSVRKMLAEVTSVQAVVPSSTAPPVVSISTSTSVKPPQQIMMQQQRGLVVNPGAAPSAQASMTSQMSPPVSRPRKSNGQTTAASAANGNGAAPSASSGASAAQQQRHATNLAMHQPEAYYARGISKMLLQQTPPTRKEDNCELVERADESDEEEDEGPLAPLPAWAQSMPAVISTHKVQLLADPDLIFPPLEVKSCNLDEIFSNFPRKKRFRDRTSSGNWTIDKLTRQEIYEANRALGIMTTAPSPMNAHRQQQPQQQQQQQPLMTSSSKTAGSNVALGRPL